MTGISFPHLLNYTTFFPIWMTEVCYVSGTHFPPGEPEKSPVFEFSDGELWGKYDHGLKFMVKMEWINPNFWTNGLKYITPEILKGVMQIISSSEKKKISAKMTKLSDYENCNSVFHYIMPAVPDLSPGSAICSVG